MKINSKFKLGTAKVRRIYLVIALALFPFLASEKASAQNATATILNGGMPGITLPVGGGAFTFDINLTTTFPSVGITYFLQSNDGSGFFCIIGRQTSGSPFSDCGNQPEPASAINRACLDPVNDNDLGCVVPNPNQPVPPGSYFISTIFLSYSAALAPGVYHIFFDSRGIVNDGPPNFNDHAITSNTFTVTIVPAPAKTRSH
jgi:hypothetical protein